MENNMSDQQQIKLDQHLEQHKEEEINFFKEMIAHFEGLRKDINDYQLTEGGRIEKIEHHLDRLDNQLVSDHKFVMDVKNYMSRLESRIPEMVHGAAKECFDDKFGGIRTEVIELKTSFNKHIESSDPHPAERNDKKNKKRESLKTAALLFASVFGGAGTVWSIQNVVIPFLKTVGIIR